LAVRNQNRIDVINGSLTWEDDTPEHATHREAKEEGNVTLGKVTLAAVIESRLKGTDLAQATFITVMTARIVSVDPYMPWHEKRNRVFLTKEDLLKKLSADKARDLSKLIDMAAFALVEASEVDPIIKHIINSF
jgi:hypothetical protein